MHLSRLKSHDNDNMTNSTTRFHSYYKLSYNIQLQSKLFNPLELQDILLQRTTFC